jgi:hypothetical protein
MSASQRDKNIRKLRQIAKAKKALFNRPCSVAEEAVVRLSAPFVALQTEFDSLFQRYGNNPSIFKDDERAGSKRKVMKKIKDAVKRSGKRSLKQIHQTELGKAMSTEDVKPGIQSRSAQSLDAA